MGKTKIDWCDYTINPVIGCKNNCPYCYARKLNDRFHFIEKFNDPKFFEERLNQINKLHNKTIFMNSMSDIAFWGNDILNKVEEAIKKNDSNFYLFLTKRPELLMNEDEKTFAIIGSNVYNGVSITKKSELWKYDCLPAYSKRFISIEPLLEDLNPDNKELCMYSYIQWVIIGAETGNRKDKVIPKKEWIMKLVEAYKEKKTPIFMKSSLKEIMGSDFIQEYPKEFKR